MEEPKRGESVGVEDEKWVDDSSLDHKGRVPLRSNTGVWKASLFIIAIEFSERLSYFGIATSLIIYLTKVIHQDLKTAAKSCNYWSGVTTMMPLLGGFVADAYLGRFTTVLASSVVYLLGLILLAMSTIVPSLKPCGTGVCHEPRKIHEVVFFLSIYLISIGTGGHKPALESFGADQFDDDHPEERKKKMSFFNWWNFGLCSGLLIGVTVVVYVQDHVSWAVADIILTAVMAGLSIQEADRESIDTNVAAIKKRNLPYPSSPAELYEVPKSQKTQGRLLCHTSKLKFLDKAAILENKQSPADQHQQNPWRLTTVTRVEEMKLLLNMIPIWLAALPFVSVTFYDKILIPVLRKVTGNERGIKILQRIGIGMVFSVLTMVVAALVERKRLSLVEKDPEKGSMSMSVFWLAPQFLIIGFGDGFTLVGLQEYFYDQVPDSMRSLGIAFYLSVIGAGSFLSSMLITAVDHITQKSGKSWFGKDLNSSRLDKFYWLLAAVAAANLCVYVPLARQYSYKNVQRKAAVVVADCYEGDNVGTTMA
ncbi:hypothetical protein HYC85_006569 [Camellia sinensis]|uniref:Major facilitator superfamily (MFS) profile domain-containing protein n=1 Tax=Camellia sinensis TaxID=4442 RepID=A0A7J7HLG9_CAMSI|nr:hypothetical protein HYC85_006569 [Camellia sinensis]